MLCLSDIPVGTPFAIGSDPSPYVVLSHSDTTGYTKVVRHGSERHLSLDSATEVKSFLVKRRSPCYHPLGFKVSSVLVVDTEVHLVVSAEGELLYTFQAERGVYKSAKSLNGALVGFLSYRVNPEDSRLPIYLSRMLGVQ
jgi:hypothetical protein